MFLFIKSTGSDDSSRRGRYHCARCGAFLAPAGAILPVNGSDRHSFVNPSGVRCNFITFGETENVGSSAEIYEEYSWFPGYGWRFAMCTICGIHLGWRFDPLDTAGEADSFHGLLIDALKHETKDEE